MKLAIMQPYFFPYLGYYQLMASVDRFVIYDDVSYIKNGWINRNRILSNGNSHYITIPVSGGSCNNKINTVKVDKSKKNIIKKAITTIEQSYKKAVYFDEVYSVIRDVLLGDYEFISEMSVASLLAIKEQLDISTEIILTSAEYKNNNLAAQERVIDINIKENATVYINAEGGQTLYDSQTFKQNGVTLKFIIPNLTPYHQIDMIDFVPALSIIDVVMNNGWEKTKMLMNSYELRG